MSRSLVLAALVIPVIAACGGVQVPQHNGYKNKNAEPWKKAKEIKLDEKMHGKVDGDLDYKDFRRAKWYVVNLPASGDLTVSLEVSPPGEDKFDMAVEVLDANGNVITKSDKDDDDGYELKKSKSLVELPAGPYLIHLYLEGRLDAAEYDLDLQYAPRELASADTFPRDVAFPPALPVVPLTDDTPFVKPTGGGGGGGGGGHRPTGGGGGGGGGGQKPPPPPPPPAGGAVSARIINVNVGGGGTQITFNKGTDAGVNDGSRGSVDGIKGSGFEAFGCGAKSCKGVVKVSADEVNRSGKVTVNQ
jgi:hypothetical protein